MRLSRQMFSHKLSCPRDWRRQPTSRLLNDGAFAVCRDPGLPFYMPIGQRVLDRLIGVLNTQAEQSGLDTMAIPFVMRDEVLARGQAMMKTFEEKVLRLGGILEGYHLITSPEMMLLDLARNGVTSWAQLPIRVVYQAEFFRGERRTAGLLKSRQIKAYIGTSLDPDADSLAESLRVFESFTDELLARLGLPTYKAADNRGATPSYYTGPPACYHYFLCDEGDHLDLPGLDPDNSTRALAISMVYQYSTDLLAGAKYRTNQNRNAPLLVGSYGLGIGRLYYCLFEHARDDCGFALGPELRPFEVSIYPRCGADVDECEAVYRHARRAGLRPALDDRTRVQLGAKAAFSDYVGCPVKVLVRDGEYVVRPRARGPDVTVTTRDELFSSVRAHLRDDAAMCQRSDTTVNHEQVRL